jgi:hypothetical protein
MSEQTKRKIESFNKSYGTLITFLWRFLFYPILALVFYSSVSYLDSHYVSREYFDKAVAKVESSQREIIGKIDGVLIYNAAAIEKAGNLNERIIRLENWRDASGGKVAWTISDMQIAPLADN